MSTVIVTYTGEPTAGDKEIMLPASKSILAREMMLAAYYGKNVPTREAGACEDIKNLYHALTGGYDRVNVGESGTALRFMLSFLAYQKGTHQLTGSKRLIQRPVEPLIKALQSLGAEIRYDSEGIIIRGGTLRGNRVTIDATESSQYVSSLMLLGARMSEGLIIEIVGRECSTPYIAMTAEIMRRAGIRVATEGREIRIFTSEDIHLPPLTERDWSAASYFYEVMALTGRALAMPGLGGTLQGDRRGTRLFAELRREVDMVDVPDLVPAYAATMCGLGLPFGISGVGHLRYKESDRLESVSGELRNLGYDVRVAADGLSWDGTKVPPLNRVNSHNDHRIVMAMAPLAALAGPIEIDGADAVNKSFPTYFQELAKAGYAIRRKESVDK